MKLSVTFANAVAAQQLCDDLTTLDGGARQEPVDLSSLSPSLLRRAQQLAAQGRLGKTTHFTVPVDDGTSMRVHVPDRVQTMLDADDLRQTKRLNPAARARVAAALSARQLQAVAQGKLRAK